MDFSKYNVEFGKELMNKYLKGEPGTELGDRRLHTIAVAEFAYKIAKRIAQKQQLPNFNPELVAFIAYVHDIGYASENKKGHEAETMRLLAKEGVHPDVAEMTRHGPYLPIGFEGMILQYADSSVRFEPMSIEERFAEIKERLHGLDLPHADELLANIEKSLPRFRQYRDIIFTLADVRSYEDFLNR